MRKLQFIEHWRRLVGRRLPLKPTAVPYGHRGSTYDQCGIRITGTPEFIDSVLVRLSDLLQYENSRTRLQAAYQEAKDRVTGELTGSYCCYLQVHERGGIEQDEMTSGGVRVTAAVGA